MPELIPEVTVRARGARRLRHGHPWVFRDDVADARAAHDGDVVRVIDSAGRPLGFAFYSAPSKIALRAVTLEDRVPRAELWAERVDDAVRYRDQACAGWDARRELFAESDGVPGLIVDRYGEHLVVQCSTAAAERVLDPCLDRLSEHRPVASVLARHDVGARRLEGLPREVRQLRGTTPRAIEVREGTLLLEVDPWTGQKTGVFLDQRENRLAVADRVHGRVLDAFCYQGTFALHAARHADEVVAVDSSAAALEQGRRAAERNGLCNVEFVRANVFEELRRRERAGERFDSVLVDPPAFARSRADLPAARRAYKEVNLRAMRLLSSGGILVTSSCSYNLGESAFLEILADAAADAQRTLRVSARWRQAGDHPIRLGFPESHYLKCLMLTVM